MEKVAFLFCVHNHQPIGNFLRALENAYEKAYFPFIQILKKYPFMKISIHYSRILWDLFKDHHPEFFKGLRGLVRTFLPTEAVSLSESGFEMIFQGSWLLLCWPLDLEPKTRFGVTIELGIYHF
jgi:Alpha-amylase/4-alpha-glucanotransferase, C-terminal